MFHKNSILLLLLNTIITINAASHEVVYQRICKELRDMRTCLQNGNCSNKQKALLAGGFIGVWLLASSGSYAVYCLCKKCTHKKDAQLYDDLKKALDNRQSRDMTDEQDIDVILSRMSKDVYPSALQQASEQERNQAIADLLAQTDLTPNEKKLTLKRYFGSARAKNIRRSRGVRFKSG